MTPRSVRWQREPWRCLAASAGPARGSATCWGPGGTARARDRPSLVPARTPHVGGQPSPSLVAECPTSPPVPRAADTWLRHHQFLTHRTRSSNRTMCFRSPGLGVTCYVAIGDGNTRISPARGLAAGPAPSGRAHPRGVGGGLGRLRGHGRRGCEGRGLLPAFSPAACCPACLPRPLLRGRRRLIHLCHSQHLAWRPRHRRYQDRGQEDERRAGRPNCSFASARSDFPVRGDSLGTARGHPGRSLPLKPGPWGTGRWPDSDR